MPIPSLQVTHRTFQTNADKLTELISGVRILAPQYRQALAEMITLQSFYLFENAIEDIAAKILCGAAYGDGMMPVVTHNARSIDAALIAMRTVGRPRPKFLLKWNKANEITGNVQHVVDTNDNFCAACRNHAARLNEIRIVRNHIAHANAGTRAEFTQVVRRRLGAAPRNLPRPGLFVLRETAPGILLLNEYLVTLGAILRSAARL